MTRPLLEVRGLSVEFQRAMGIRAVDGVDLEIRRGETLGLIGESGSGKTSTALALLGLLPAGARASGSARWRGRELLGADPDTLRAIRGAEIALVPQDPMAALHPLMPVERQVAEAVLAHAPAGQGRRGRAAARARAMELLVRTGLPAHGIQHARFAFEWSGGMRQRALIAMAVAHSPALLIADEPTAALDATTRAEILALLRGLRDETGMAMLLISHDVAAVAASADRIAVMHRGRIIRSGTIDDVCRSPGHPYTRELVAGLGAASQPSRSSRPGARQRDSAGSAPAPRSAPAPATEPRFPPASAPAPRSTPVPATEPEPVLRVDGVTVRYPLRRRAGAGPWFTAVDDVSFELAAG
jgi:ABC-type glutathione transport system ATPase component